MFKRSQKKVSEASKHWYQDKYQHVLVQRNLLALMAALSLLTAVAASLSVLRLAPLKSVEPYLLQIDEKSGITQRVNPITSKQYRADEAIDKYFTTLYLRVREGYNINILHYNYNIVRLMSTPGVLAGFRKQIDPKTEGGMAKRLGAYGLRDVRIRSMVYIVDPRKNVQLAPTNTKIMQVRFTAKESTPSSPDRESQWIVTITFEYADLNLNNEEQLLNPLGYTVTSYQIQPEIE